MVRTGIGGRVWKAEISAGAAFFGRHDYQALTRSIMRIYIVLPKKPEAFLYPLDMRYDISTFEVKVAGSP